MFVVCRRDDGGSGRDSYSRQSEPPKERPRLQLAPRSKPTDAQEKSATSPNAPSVFGRVMIIGRLSTNYFDSRVVGSSLCFELRDSH